VQQSLTALKATVAQWFNPVQQMALMDSFDDFSSHDTDQISALHC
jgi:hypothetical protein